MRFLIPIAFAVFGLAMPGGGGASATTRLDVTPKHGHRFTAYTVSFRAEFASSKETNTQYVIGAVNGTRCARGANSFGKIQSGPYRVGQTVRFRLRYPKQGLCVGVFHGVAHFERREGDHWTDRRMGRFAFRVLSH